MPKAMPSVSLWIWETKLLLPAVRSWSKDRFSKEHWKSWKSWSQVWLSIHVCRLLLEWGRLHWRSPKSPGKQWGFFLSLTIEMSPFLCFCTPGLRQSPAPPQSPQPNQWMSCSQMAGLASLPWGSDWCLAFCYSHPLVSSSPWQCSFLNCTFCFPADSWRLHDHSVSLGWLVFVLLLWCAVQFLSSACSASSKENAFLKRKESSHLWPNSGCGLWMWRIWEWQPARPYAIIPYTPLCFFLSKWHWCDLFAFNGFTFSLRLSLSLCILLLADT